MYARKIGMLTMRESFLPKQNRMQSEKFQDMYHNNTVCLMYENYAFDCKKVLS